MIARCYEQRCTDKIESLRDAGTRPQAGCDDLHAKPAGKRSHSAFIATHKNTCDTRLLQSCHNPIEQRAFFKLDQRFVFNSERHCEGISAWARASENQRCNAHS